MPTASEPIEDEIDLREYLRVLWRRRWVILGVTLASAVAAVVITRTATPLYEASTTVLIRTGGGAGAALPESAALLLGNRPTIQNYVELLKSRTVAERVAASMAGGLSPTPEQLQRVRDAISVQTVQGTDAIRVSVRLSDPAESRLVANRVVEAFTQVNEEMNRTEARSALKFIETQLAQVEQKVQAAENALLGYKQEHRVVEPSEQARAAVDKLAELEKLQASAAIALQENETRTVQVRAELEKQLPTLTTARTISDNPLIQSYKLRLTDLEAQLSAARQNLAPGHPQVTAMQAQADEIRRLMGREVERVVSAQTEALNPIHQELLQQMIGLQVEQLALQARQQAIRRLLATQEAALLALPSKELELARLTREQRVNEEIYVMLRTRYEELRIQEASATADVRVVDPAVLPRTPVSPRPLLNLAVAIFLGLFSGVAVSFVLEFADTSVKSEEELERLLGVPVLGRIPEYRPEGPEGRGTR